MCALVEEYADKKAKEVERETARKTERETAQKIAKQFLEMGISVDKIAEGISVLSVEEIIELQESLL